MARQELSAGWTKRGFGQTEEPAGSGEAATGRPKRSSNNHSSVATNEAAVGFPKASTVKNGIEDLA